MLFVSRLFFIRLASVIHSKIIVLIRCKSWFYAIRRVAKIFNHVKQFRWWAIFLNWSQQEGIFKRLNYRQMYYLLTYKVIVKSALLNLLFKHTPLSVSKWVFIKGIVNFIQKGISKKSCPKLSQESNLSILLIMIPF